MRQLLLILLLAVPLWAVSQKADRVDSLQYYGNRLDAEGDRDGAVEYYTKALDLLIHRREFGTERFWEIALSASLDVESLYNDGKALEIQEKFLRYVRYPEAIPNNKAFYHNISNAQSLAFQRQDYDKAIYYGTWLLSQMEASEPFSREDYYGHCLQIFRCYRLALKPFYQCYDFLYECGRRCRSLTGTIPPDLVEYNIQLDIENKFYASALQNIDALHQYYKFLSESDTAYHARFISNLMQGSRLFCITNQLDKAYDCLAELQDFIKLHNVSDRKTNFSLNIQLALVYQQGNLFCEALDCYEKALCFNCDPPDCYDSRIYCLLQEAICYEQKGDVLNALSLSNKACRLSSINKSLMAHRLGIQSRILYLFYKACLGNEVNYQALLDYGNTVMQENDPALTDIYVNSVSRVCPKYRDYQTNSQLLALLYQQQTDDIAYKLLQIQEDGKFPSISANIHQSNLMFTLHRSDTASNNGLMYNLLLAYKGAVLNSIIRLGATVDRSGDPELKSLYSRVRQLKAEKSRLGFVSKPGTDSVGSILFYEENRLMRLMLSTNGNYLSFSNWESVRDALDSNGMAVEFFCYQKIKPDLQYEDGCTYGALVLRKDFQQPVYLELFNDSIVNGPLPKMHSDLNSTMLRKTILDPILRYAKPGDRIYYSPSGLIHNLALENLLDDSDNPVYLGFNLMRVSSTSQVMEQRSTLSISKILLLGDIDYSQSGKGFRPIPGTKAEVDDIERQMLARNGKVSRLSRANATEEAFKRIAVDGFGVIHLATHGFFLNEDKAVEKDFFKAVSRNSESINPLLRSGLALAGANRAWSGNRVPDDVDDGILTAQEIKDLDLSRTQMVVLSACETGLGDINSDGVFGLQRAFKSAGVQTIVMSLWKVSDNATSLLMTEFYRALLASGDRHKAFLQAKEAVRARFPEAYYWAGFVMLD